MSMKRILFVLSSHDRVADTEICTRFSMKQFATCYKHFKKAEYDIAVASIRGGKTTPEISKEDAEDLHVQYVLHDSHAMELIENAVPLRECHGQAFAAVCFIGGYGCMFDIPNDLEVDKIGRVVFEHGGATARLLFLPFA